LRNGGILLPYYHANKNVLGYLHRSDFFINDILDSLSQEESYASSGLMITATSLIHMHTQMQRPVHIGSTRPRRGNLKRDIEDGWLYQDYFHPAEAVFMEALFRRRYRISRYMFLTIL
jgi:hypothetical protein